MPKLNGSSQHLCLKSLVMKLFSCILFVGFAMSACVPAKKYNELLEKEKQCSSELEKYKTNALNFEADAKDFKTKYEVLTKELKQLVADSSQLGNRYRTLYAKYDRMVKINEALETNYDKLRLSGAKETATLNMDLEAKKIQLQKREDELLQLEQELTAKQQRIAMQEAALSDLNELIQQQEMATKALKEKVAKALQNFESKGLSIVEKNGKIYVSMEAKLLFQSGSTTVEAEGKTALIELAKVLETETELEIIVEGHTDTDKMAGTKHPKNNWELSVLRSTSVIGIMTGNSALNPKQLMAAGRSAYHPVDESNKAKNRRIEIIISPNLDELYKLISEE